MIEPLCPVCGLYAQSVQQETAGNTRTRVWSHGAYSCRLVDQVGRVIDKAAAAKSLDPRIGRGA